jgi:site-specific DNA-methyltransferase (adenine-specific)
MGRHRIHANATERKRANRALHRARLQAPCVQIGALVTLYLGDAHVIAPTLQPIDALVTDPPYGVHFDFTKRRRTAARWTANMRGDDQPFDPTHWLRYPQVILWGAHRYRLPAANGYITWDKRGGATPDDFPGCELAWSNVPGCSAVHTQLWRGNRRAGEENIVHGWKLHPAQKPVALMRLCVEKTTGTVLDPFMGSGTTGVACVRLGRPFVGIELDPQCFDEARKRLQAEVATAHQVELFPVQKAGGMGATAR